MKLEEFVAKMKEMYNLPFDVRLVPDYSNAGACYYNWDMSAVTDIVIHKELANPNRTEWDEGYSQLVRRFTVLTSIPKAIFYTLHEIGHSQTFKDFNWNDYKRDLQELRTKQLNGEVSFTEALYRYRLFPMEKAADEWAVNEIRKHAELFKQLAEELEE